MLRGGCTDICYFFLSHVLVQFILILVTASTTVAAAIAVDPVKALVVGMPLWLQVLLAVFVARPGPGRAAPGLPPGEDPLALPRGAPLEPRPRLARGLWSTSRRQS